MEKEWGIKQHSKEKETEPSSGQAMKKYGTIFASLEKISEDSPERAMPAISVAELQRLCDGDEILENLLLETLNQFKAYAENVAALEENSAKLNDGGITIEEFNRFRDRQHDTHESTVGSVRILVRNLAQRGKDTKWAESFFPGGQENRAAIGKFALLTVFQQLKSAGN